MSSATIVLRVKMEEHKTIRKIAVIGGGPKGIYGFERLAAWFKVNPPFERTEIHIFNRSDSFGAGENFRIGQPHWLLINNPVGDVNMWAEEKPSPVVQQPLSLTEWLCQIEGQHVTDQDYIARATVGRYLVNGFRLIASNLPERVHGRYTVGEVTDIYKDSGKYVLCLKTGGDEKHHGSDRYNHILLATGHPKNRDTKEQLRYQSFADEHNRAGYIPFIYPAETVFSSLPPGCSVGIKGVGLTFVDAVLALTEGKGGVFQRDSKSDKLLYIASGYEPKVIFPFSRSGLPMLPRRSVRGEMSRFKFFTKPVIQKMQTGGKLDFYQQIWPLLRQEMIYAYYDIDMKAAGHPRGLSDSADFEDVQRIVEEYHSKYPGLKRFDPETFLDPIQEKKSFNNQTFNQYIQSEYRSYIKEARKGELKSPLAAVSAVWRRASPLFCELYSFGGLTPESQRVFDRSFRGKLNRVTFGPPVESAEKVYALMESGILNFETAGNPNLSLDEKTGSFILESGQNYTRHSVQYLVDARIPKMSLTDDGSSLFRNLLDRELITMYENRTDHETYRTGAINITKQGFVIDKLGNVNFDIAVTGTPTEGITFDNDTLSRNRNNFVNSWAEFISKEYAKSEENIMQTDHNSHICPLLTAITAPWMDELFDNPLLLDDLFREYGSPINIHHADPFAENFELFSRVLEKHGLDYTIFFARKANKCRIFVKEANRLGFGMDTASYRELKECLDLGCDPEKLVLTAAVKNEELVRLALQHGVLIILDNKDECRLVNKLAGQLGLRPGIGIRVSGFYDNGNKLYSRFGFDIDHVAEFITSQLGRENPFENLQFGGFHFHLNGYSMKQRSEALLQTILQADRLHTHGYRTSFIDMGGGLLMNYLSDKSEWEEFWIELKKAVKGERPPVTFGNSGLGYELINGELHGEPDVYPYYNETSKDNFLDEVLSYKNHRGETPASLLRERGIELRMEPGRSLLDQTGITLAKVIHRKKDMQGNWLIGLEMNRSQLASSSADFLVDPVYIPSQKDAKEREPTPLFLTGGYCLEQDFILIRKIVLPRLPDVGDMICFPNTAGYMMHFYETQSHLFDFTTNLVINKDSDGMSIQRDEL